MKKIFLTSAAWKVLPQIVPDLGEQPKKLKVAFIPTAGDPYEKTPWIADDRNMLKKLGFQIFDFDLKYQIPETIEQFMEDKDIIFVAGGNTFYLLEWSQKSGFEKVIQKQVENGKIYIGSSAGSVIAGPDIEAVGTFDDPQDAHPTGTKGFGLVDFVVLPHYKKERASEFQHVIDEFSGKYVFRLLEDNSAIYMNNEKLQILDVT